MSWKAMLFMAFGWAIAWALFLYCFARILFGNHPKVPAESDTHSSDTAN